MRKSYNFYLFLLLFCSDLVFSFENLCDPLINERKIYIKKEKKWNKKN